MKTSSIFGQTPMVKRGNRLNFTRCWSQDKLMMSVTPVGRIDLEINGLDILPTIFPWKWNSLLEKIVSAIELFNGKNKELLPPFRKKSLALFG
jgi:hypothetical protein